MKNYLFFLIGMLALVSCTNESDEPRPNPTGGEDLYLATHGFMGHPEMIYNLDGDTIYQCAEDGHILELLSEGSDWYASIANQDGTYSVVKDGTTVCTTQETIWCMAVENGIVYTVQENTADNTVWVHKDFERLYELDRNVNFNTICVSNGIVSFTVSASKPYTWINGRTVEFGGLNSAPEEGFGHTFGCDRSGYDVLITYESYQVGGKYMYWWNGKNYDLPQTFIPSASRLVNGHAFILGAERTTLSPGGAHYVPAVFIDGMKTVLNDEYDFKATQVVADGMDTYVLVNDVGGNFRRSRIYKNLQRMILPENITIPEDMIEYYDMVFYDSKTISLDNLGITAIAVVKKGR